MRLKRRHLNAGALVFVVCQIAAPANAWSQADSSFGGEWEEAAASVGPVLSRHDYYGDGTMLGARLGLAAGVAPRVVVRLGGEGAVAIAPGVFGLGVRAVLNVHHDTIIEVPLEFGGWSW